MKNITRSDIPEAARYDMTLEKIGYSDITTKHPKVIIRCCIDNGPNKLKRVSHAFNFGDPDTPEMWREFYAALGIEPAQSKDKWKKLAPFVKACKTARFSAYIQPYMLVLDGNKWREAPIETELTEDCIVKYRMHSFDRPSVMPEYTFTTKSKFSRK